MRGEVWTVRGDGLASKPRPAVLVQADDCDEFDTILVCPLTSKEKVDGKTRVPIAPSEANGLKRRSWLMTEKVIPIWKDELGEKIGELSARDIERMDDAIRAVLDLA